MDLGLDPGVDSRGGVVEQQHVRVGQQGPGEGNPLPLTAGERQALLPHHSVVAVRQLADEPVRFGSGRGASILSRVASGRP